MRIILAIGMSVVSLFAWGYDFANAFAVSERYCIVDLSGGAEATSYPVVYTDTVPAGGWSDEYKTTKLVLKRCEPGSFLMDEAQKPSCRVTLTQPFYLGVFEVTQK